MITLAACSSAMAEPMGFELMSTEKGDWSFPWYLHYSMESLIVDQTSGALYAGGDVEMAPQARSRTAFRSLATGLASHNRLLSHRITGCYCLTDAAIVD